jgi:hypothetical protein
MESIDARQAYLKRITLVTATQRYPLGGEPATPSPSPTAADTAGAKPPRRPTLASEAMRWTYVLRSRERWKGDDRAVGQHERSASTQPAGSKSTRYAQAGGKASYRCSRAVPRDDA